MTHYATFPVLRIAECRARNPPVPHYGARTDVTAGCRILYLPRNRPKVINAGWHRYM